MNNEDLKSKVLDRLKKEEVKVKPKWQFTLKNVAFWSSFGLATILGSVAMSLIIFKLLNNDWDVYEIAGHTLPNFIFLTLPYFWIAIFVVFSGLAYYNFRHTRSGYKQPVAIVVLLSLIISMMAGFGIYLFEGSQYIDQQAVKRFELYRQMELNPKKKIWEDPEKGLIAGEVIESDEETITLEDFQSQVWTIETDELDMEFGVPRAVVAGDQLAITGEVVEEEEMVFSAKTIRPWKGTFFKNSAPFNKNLPNSQPVNQFKKLQFEKKLKENES